MNYPRLTTLCRAALIITFAGCVTSSRPPSASPDLSVVDDSLTSYSAKAQEVLRSANLSIVSAYDPTTLEESDQLRSQEQGGGRALVISEAFYLRGESIGTTDDNQALADLLRAAHYAYEAIFSDTCNQQSGMCELLTQAYNRATSAIVSRASPLLRSAPHIDASRYILDQEGDGDPITLTEWTILPPESEEQEQEPHFGTPMVGCRTEGELAATGNAPRVCSPITFLLTFDERVSSDRAHAHLVAYDSFKTTGVSLHGREVPLREARTSTWREILTSTPPLTGAITCLSDQDPTLPTALFITRDTPQNDRWSTLLAGLSNDETVVTNFNLCSLATPSDLEAPELSAFIQRSLAHPSDHLPVELILFSQGDENVRVARSLIENTRELRRRSTSGTAGITIAGSMHITEHSLTTSPHRSDDLSPQSPAERDIRRLLSRLLNDEGALLHKRNPVASEDVDMNLSPVL